jgi:MFS family permease
VNAAAEAVVERPLRQRPEFLKLWGATTISLVGDEVTLLALPLAAVLVLDASAAQVGLLTAVGLAPHLLFSLFAGVWIDRLRRRRRLLVAADLGRALLLATIPLAAAFDSLELWLLYAVAFGAGTLAVAFDLSYPSLLLLLVPRRNVVEANSKLSLSRSASWIVGPALGGFLVQLLRAPNALLVDAGSFVCSAFLLGRIRVDEPEPEPPVEGEGFRSQLAEGFRFVLGDRLIRADLGCAATINLFNFVFHAIFVLYVVRELGLSPGLLGLVLGVGAVGAVAGALVATRVERRLGIGPAIVLGSVLFPAPLVLVPLASGSTATKAAMLIAAELVAAFGVMIFDVAAGSLVYLRTPQRLRSRTLGTFRFVNMGIRPIGALLGGLLGSAIGLRPTLWIAVLGSLLGVLWLVFSPVPRLREVPAEAA